MVVEPDFKALGNIILEDLKIKPGKKARAYEILRIFITENPELFPNGTIVKDINSGKLALRPLKQVVGALESRIREEELYTEIPSREGYRSLSSFFPDYFNTTQFLEVKKAITFLMDRGEIPEGHVVVNGKWSYVAMNKEDKLVEIMTSAAH